MWETVFKVIGFIIGGAAMIGFVVGVLQGIISGIKEIRKKQKT